MKQPCHAIRLIVFLALFSLVSPVELIAAQTMPARTIPARALPTPTTVSPELQTAISQPWEGSSAQVVMTHQQWKAMAKHEDEQEAASVEGLKKQAHVTVEAKTIGGVPVFSVKPEVIPEENRRRLLVHVHGGAYVFFAGQACLPEAIAMAHFTKTEVLSVDYRMPPDFPFPAAIDDTVAVWKEVIKTHTPRNVALFGTSAGGGLTLTTVLKLKELGVPLPGALMAGTPWSDLSKTGDSYFTNALLDNVLGTYEGNLEGAAKLYAGSHDLKEPLLSPVYGDLSGFPPTILVSGTRDLFLSNTVRIHQKLLEAGVPADLLVFEGQSHAQFMIVDGPEAEAAGREMAQFFDRHLER